MVTEPNDAQPMPPDAPPAPPHAPAPPPLAAPPPPPAVGWDAPVSATTSAANRRRSSAKPLSVIGVVLFVLGSALGGTASGVARNFDLMFASIGFALILAALVVAVWNRATLGRGVRLVVAALACVFAVGAVGSGIARFATAATTAGGAGGSAASPAIPSGSASPAASSPAPASAPTYALSLPAGWVDLDPTSPSSKAAFDAAAKANPTMAGMISAFESNGGTYRLAANRLTGDVVISTSIPTQGLSLAEVGQGLSAQFRMAPGVSAAPSPDTTPLPAGDALHWNLSLAAKNASGASYSVSESVYVVVHGDTAVLVVFVALPGGVAAPETQILDSLVIGPAAANSAASAMPSPTAVDVAGAFNAALTSGGWDAHLNIAGEVTSDGVPQQVTGTLDVESGSAHAVLTTGKMAYETIATASVTYVKEDGVWLTSASRGTDSVVGAAGFTDAGVQSHDGQQLHHMVLPAGLPVPAIFVLPPSGAADVRTMVEGWADDEGTPVEIDVTEGWAQPGTTGAQSIGFTLTMAVAGPSQTFAVPSGDQVWVWSTSTSSGYSIAYPSSWEHTPSSSKQEDLYQGDDGSFLVAVAFAASGDSLNAWASYARTHLAKWSNLSKPVFDRVSSVTLDGVPARQLIYHGTYNGVVKYHVDLLAIKGDTVYELVLSVPDALTSADSARWGAFLASFTFE